MGEHGLAVALEGAVPVGPASFLAQATVMDVNRQTDTGAKAPLEFTMQARVFVLNGDAVQLPAELQSGGE